MQSEKLIQQLLEQTRQILNQAEKLKDQDMVSLTWRESSTSWNILECLEHMNLYGHFYLPQLESKIARSNTKPDAEFKSGFLGNYFAQSMLPKEKLNKMSTFKDKNPLNSSLNKSVIDEFIHQQIKLLDLLNKARMISLNKVKIETTLSRFLTLKLGDILPFLINHMIRHFAQIDRIQAKRNAAMLITPATPAPAR